MMGSQAGGQERLFYSFNLDDHVPSNHLLRGIDRFLDLSELRQHLAPFYSHTGRPSVDPELMVRMLIVGYCFGIRSERRLCEEVHLNLAYRWFCRPGLEDQVPDHSTFSKNRHGRFRDSDAFRHVFEGVVRRCMSEGLVKGEGFAIDASLIEADANRQRGVAGGDTNYGAGSILGWLVQEKQIAPHVPVWDKSERDDGTFGRSDFTFDATNNHYQCPAGPTPNCAARCAVADIADHNATACTPTTRNCDVAKRSSVSGRYGRNLPLEHPAEASSSWEAGSFDEGICTVPALLVRVRVK
jgi:transposase